jgi:NAD(P)-dependent dehydrogenase (short-subunit alcohol dehydrogenase family)
MNKSHEITNVSELLDLSDRRVLVTGASGNIGGGIALRLAEAGAAVVVHYSSGKRQAERLVAAIESAGGVALAAKADLISDVSTAAMFARLKSEDLLVDLVVNNAAVQPVKQLASITREDWRHVQASNLESAFMVTQSAAQEWQQRGVAGAVVNIASIEGCDPAVGHAHYATSKAGLLMMTRAMALEYGPGEIRINAVSPGLIDREGLAEHWPDGVDRWLRQAPLGKLGLPSDVADAVLFLLSPAARWISGVNLVVDGGMSTVSRW